MSREKKIFGEGIFWFVSLFFLFLDPLNDKFVLNNNKKDKKDLRLSLPTPPPLPTGYSLPPHPSRLYP